MAAIAREACRSCASLWSTVQGARRFRLNQWESDVKDVLALRDYVVNQVECAEKDGRGTAWSVRTWMREVDEFEAKVNKLRDRLTRATRACGCGSMVKFQAAKMGLKAKRLLEEGSFPAGLVTERLQRTASRVLDDLEKNLYDDDTIRRIGLWGVGGVGKTTLVKKLKMELNRASDREFSIVIYVTVSKDFDRKKLQMKIAERLKLVPLPEESVEMTASRLFERLKAEKFLLILDDVWHIIELDKLGIPQPEQVDRGSKTVLISRSLDVCRGMAVEAEVKMDVLNDEEAWDLFRQRVGWAANLEHTKPFAQAVVRECCGLPLVLAMVGITMRGKSATEQWKHALDKLQASTNGVIDKMYSSVKLSYEALEDKTLKSCFLYCALYPDDFSIEISELVKCWLGEGLLGEHQSYDESLKSGIEVVRRLKDSCLLKYREREGSVKMHNVVHGVAKRIASNEEEEYKSLCHSRLCLREIDVSGLQDSLTRVSFTNNEITKLPDLETRCSKVTTLLLQGNLPLEEVSEKFLRSFRALRVLSLSKTSIKDLSPLLQLSDLRTLLLADCVSLEEVSGLGNLGKLEVLDLQATRIKELPEDFKKLINLRHVNLSLTHYLKQVPAEIISKWTCLEVLDMKLSGYQWCVEEDGQVSVEELECLERLHTLSLRLKSLPNTDSFKSFVVWLSRVRRFLLSVGDSINSLPTIKDDEERTVTISNSYASGEWIAWFMRNSTSLILNSCSELSTTIPSLTTCSRKIASGIELEGLKSLTISDSICDLGATESGVPYYRDLLPNLEELKLHNLPNLVTISAFANHLGLLFRKLKSLEVYHCNQMRHLLSYRDGVLELPSLQTLRVSFCDQLEILFRPTGTQEYTVFPNLRMLELYNLPRLVLLCNQGESWPSLELIAVFRCYNLRKLPLTTRNARIIKAIRGESQWWSRLHWDDPSFRQILENAPTTFAVT